MPEYRTLPDRYSTNLCFGGPDLRTDLPHAVDVGAIWPRPGLQPRSSVL
jgi:hypothetical protein